PCVMSWRITSLTVTPSSSARSFTAICDGRLIGPLGLTGATVRGPMLGMGLPRCGPLPPRPDRLPGPGRPAPGPPGRAPPGRAGGRPPEGAGRAAVPAGRAPVAVPGRDGPAPCRTPPLPFGPPAGRTVGPRGRVDGGAAGRAGRCVVECGGDDVVDEWAAGWA